MTDTLPRLDAPGDAELISAVRGGDVSAYGPLFERHVEAARRLARQLVGAADADDLVSDAFTKVLRVLQGGGGPDVAFRAYLLTAVRRLHVDKIRAGSRLHTTDDMEMFDPGVPFKDTAVEGFESAAAAKAFASLPERWQAVLWHTEVEGQKPAEVAEILGMTPNSVSALAYRAREGLRQAFLNSHAMEVDDDACASTHQLLGGYIRGGVSKRDAGKVEKHLDECRKCMAIYLELTEVNNNLALILAPLLLGGAGAGYLATAGVATKGALLLFLDRAKDTVSSNGPATAVAGVAAVGVVAASAVFALQLGGNDPAPNPRADIAPPAATTAPVEPPATDGPPVDEPVDEPADEPADEPGIAPTVAPTTTPTAVATTARTTRPSAPPTTAPPTTAPPAVIQSDVMFSSPPTATATSAGSGTYQVAVAVTGIPTGQSITVQTSSAPAGSARLALRQLAAATTGGVTVECPNGCVLTSGAPSLLFTATVTGDQAQNLTITLVPSAGFSDPDTSDNAMALRLEPAAPPAADLSLAFGTAQRIDNPGIGNDDFVLPVVVSGFLDAAPVSLGLDAGDIDLLSVTSGEGVCNLTSCILTDTDGDGTVTVTIVGRAGFLHLGDRITAAVASAADPDQTDNSATWVPPLIWP